MTTFLLDLWQDLRAKRLWPVAVALLAAIVAVPAMLFKPASSTAPSTAATQASNAAKLPTVTLDASSVSGSHLNVFKQKNPFDVLRDPDPKKQAASDANGANTLPTLPSTSGSSGTGTTPSTGTTGTGTGGTTPKGTPGTPGTPGTHYFTYTADVRFGPRGHEQAFDALHHLDLLPSGENPIVAFMGAREGKTAVFFIADPAFRADGEGHCDPDPDHCMFVSLTTDPGEDEETLSAENGEVEYTLELTGLHIETLDQSQAVGDTTPSKSGSSAKRSRKASATLLSTPVAMFRR
jgi:hypothetical protein